MHNLTERQQSVLDWFIAHDNWAGPTEVGLAFGFSYGQASARVMPQIKALVTMELLERREFPKAKSRVQYRSIESNV